MSTSSLTPLAIGAALFVTGGAVHAQGGFPSEFRGAWGESLEACEPEFTSGLTIAENNVFYYEGWDTLISIRDRSDTYSPSGLVQVLEAELSYTHADSPQQPRTVFYMLLDGDLYVYERPTSGGWRDADRYVRCPPGSTGEEAMHDLRPRE